MATLRLKSKTASPLAAALLLLLPASLVLGRAAQAQSYDVENGPQGQQLPSYNRLYSLGNPKSVTVKRAEGYQATERDRSHPGLFLRLRLGGDIVAQSYNDPQGRQLALGEALELNPQVGVRVGPQWIAYLDAFAAYATGAYGGDRFNAPALGYAGVGPGLLHYFQPSNAWVSGSLFFYGTKLRGLKESTLALDPKADVSFSENLAGGLARLNVGREWWFAPRWSGGLAGALSYGLSRQSLGPDAGKAWVSTFILALMFSGTYD